jgi:outer membrane receptor protein involved in Fe transport
LSLFTPDFDLYDLNRVETLRGPQGTLFGSGSIGGTVRYITNQPNVDEFEAELSLDLNTITQGSNGGHIKAMVNTPLANGGACERLYTHLNMEVTIDAYGEGDTFNADVNEGSRDGARISATFSPSDTLTITPRIIFRRSEYDGYNRQEAFNMFANPFTTTKNCKNIQATPATFTAAGRLLG